MRELLLLSAILAVSGASRLVSNVDEVTPGVTKNAQLKCIRNHSGQDGDGISFTSVDSIIIFKFQPDHSQVVVASVMKLTNTVSVSDTDATAVYTSQGDIDELTVTWSVASTKTPGTYRCDINGKIAGSDEIKPLTLNGVRIKERQLNMDDVKTAINDAIKDLVDKQKDLVEENQNLKNFITNQLTVVNNKIEQQARKHETELAALKSEFERKLTQSVNLNQVAEEAEKIAKKVVGEDNDNDKKKHDEIITLINMVKDQCEKDVDDVEDKLLKLTSEYQSKTSSIEHEQRQMKQRANNRTASMSTDMNTFNVNCQNSIAQLRIELSKNISHIKCTCPTPAPPKGKTTSLPITPTKGSTTIKTATTATTTSTTTLATTTRKNRRPLKPWFTGKYVLVKPASVDCPMQKLGHQGEFEVKPYFEYRGFNQNLKKEMQDRFKMYLKSDTSKSTLQYCGMNYIPKVWRPPARWPKGKYCIREYQSGYCPPDFRGGRFIFDVKRQGGQHYVGNDEICYCCKSDGSADVPMKLPTGSPFYLYRRGGKCQTVANMKVREDAIQVDLIGDTTATRRASGTFPDFMNDQHFTTYLCYYYQ